jgi:ABC-type polysaccharide transport system permease subunit
VLLLASLKPSTALPWDAVPLTLANFTTVFAAPITYTLLANTAVYAIGTITFGLGCAVVLAIVGSTVPAWRGLRLQVADALADRG